MDFFRNYGKISLEMNEKESLYLKALELSSSGNIKKSQKLVKQILKIDPEFGKAHYLLGWIYFEYVNDLNKAKKHAKIAMKNDTGNALGYYLYFDILLAEQNLEEIKSVAEGIEKLKVIDKAYIYHKMANIYEARRQYIHAIDLLVESKEYGNSNSWDDFIDLEISRVRRKISVQ